MTWGNPSPAGTSSSFESALNQMSYAVSFQAAGARSSRIRRAASRLVAYFHFSSSGSRSAIASSLPSAAATSSPEGIVRSCETRLNSIESNTSFDIKKLSITNRCPNTCITLGSATSAPPGVR